MEELLRQNGGHLPVNVIFLLEGEEEVGSGSLSQFIKEHREDWPATLLWFRYRHGRSGHPTFSYGLRPCRGGNYRQRPFRGSSFRRVRRSGGQSIAALAEIIASFHDEEGRVAVRGFYDGVEPIATWERSMWATVPGMSNEELAKLTGVDTVVTEAGFTGAECIYARPTLELNGIGGGYQGEGSKTIIPSRAFAKISCRLVPGQDPERIESLLEEHVKTHTPRGVSVEFKREHSGRAYVCDPNSEFGLAAQQALEEAFGRKPVLVREGGSIPIIEEMKNVLGADALMLGMCLPDARIHSPNENFSVELFTKGIEMSQILLRRLGQIKR
ncbi:MAG: M20/M25/M40 family metallo-hydrolase [Akkermansia sp.]